MIIRPATQADLDAAADHGPIRFDPPHKLNRMALDMAADWYASQCGEVDEVALGAAIEVYMEAVRS